MPRESQESQPNSHHISVAEDGIHRSCRVDRRLHIGVVSAVGQPQRAQEAGGLVEDMDQRRRGGERRQRVRQAAQGNLKGK